MSRNRCSQCGQEGHNRRNRGCRVNLEQAQAQAQAHILIPEPNPTVISIPEPEPESVLNLFHTYSKRATDNFATLVKFMNNHQQYLQEGMTAVNFLLSCITIIHLICDDMSLALDHNNTPARYRALTATLFHQLETKIQTLNEMIETCNPRATIRVFLYLTETGRFKINLVNIDEKKRTSAYLREISLVLTDADPDSNCECPLCFDPLPSSDAVFTGCNHPYCAPCFKTLATSIKDKTVRPTCSLCRAEITQLSFGKVEICNEISQHFYNL
jgi:hypothetical protein